VQVRKDAPAVTPGALEGRNAIKETWQQELARSLSGQPWVERDSIKIISHTAVPVIKLTTQVRRFFRYARLALEHVEQQLLHSSRRSVTPSRSSLTPLCPSSSSPHRYATTPLHDRNSQLPVLEVHVYTMSCCMHDHLGVLSHVLLQICPSW
jgi:hypothetical protein